MQWQLLAAQLINGIALGSTYALIALGYTMVYGIIRLINFAHGDIFMLGAYFGLIAISSYNLSLIPAMIISMCLAALVGITLDRIAYRPLRQSPRITVLITAIGASLLIQSLAQLIFGADYRSFPAKAIPIKIIRLGSIIITNRQIIIFGTAILLMILLHLIVNSLNSAKPCGPYPWTKKRHS